MIVMPFNHKKMLSEDEQKELESKPIKTYRYRLKLEVYEDEPLDNPTKRFCIDTLSVFNNNEFVNEALKNRFQRLLETFNRENE